MKKTNIIIAAVVIIVIIIVLVLTLGHKSSTAPVNTTAPITLDIPANSNLAPTVSATDTQTVAVSSTLSKYENQELGFSLQYPKAWTVVNAPLGPTFNIPGTSTPANKSTIVTLQANIYTAGGACTFPPVAPSSIKENTTVKAGSMTFNMISVATTTAGSNYFNRMYTLPQGTAKNPYCYYFSFSSVSAISKDASVTASNQTTVQAADSAFTAMVKSYAPIVIASGDSETSHAAGK